ncbi:acyl-CoA thioesterase [Pseudonocardia lacus]|uniref:acyl-CoA thioesterase n=1 Tax=Pseudonocardia lacus TaxID=2835865 RepID=UPI001BDCEB56|nr:thioesterase family protein [Pseudonocardia lacus]
MSNSVSDDPTAGAAEGGVDSAPLGLVPMTPEQDGRPARVRIQRRVEWAQTDAAGHHHWSSVLHWAEQAETVLHERLGIAGRTFGREPRVHLSMDFSGRLYFRDLVEIEIWVRQVGTSSVRYAFTVTRAGEPAASGEMVAVHVDAGSGRPQPWPQDLRDALTGGGEQVPELVGAG